MKISILVPFRAEQGEAGRARRENWMWLERRWRALIPDAEIVMGTDTGMPFSKTTAIRDAYSRAKGDVFILADADSWCDVHQIAKAVEYAKRWNLLVVPWSNAYRLSAADSKRIRNLEAGHPDPVTKAMFERADDYKPSPSTAAMVTVIMREDFERVGGMDPVFRGWGAEDVAFALACETLLGRNKLMLGVAWALHHERPRKDGRRVWEGDDAKHNMGQGARYWKARGKVAEMLALVSEHPLAKSKTPLGTGPSREKFPVDVLVPSFQQVHEVPVPENMVRELIRGGMAEGEVLQV